MNKLSNFYAEFKAQLIHLAAGDANTLASLRATATAVTKPAVDWLHTSVLGTTGHLKDQLPFYEAACVVSPRFLATHTIEECLKCCGVLRSRHLLCEDDVKGIATELPRIIHELNQQPPGTIATVDFWKQRKEAFPMMCLLLRKLATLSQSSASAERVFSLLQQVLTAQQEASALGDYLEVALMCRYNAE